MKSLLRAGYFASPVAYVSLVLTLVVSCEFGMADLLFQPLCGPNTAYRQHFLGNPEAAETNTACGILCLANNACFSFTYHRGNRLCQLSTGVEETCNLLEMEADSTYYVVMGSDCSGPSHPPVGRRKCTCNPGFRGSNCEGYSYCGAGFIPLPGSDSCYYLSKITMDYAGAKADCEARGAMLVCPETVAELTEIRNMLRATGLGHVYYGATNSALKGTWVCDGTGQTLASDTGAGTAGPLFHRSQPNNLDGVQHCTSGEKRTDFLIGDIDCTSARYYLCEKP